MSEEQEMKSIDDLIACVIGMGFSLEDAQQAVSLGKLNMEDAIEWILAGKPQPEQPAATSTLRLRQDADQSGEAIGANPFSNPQPLTLPHDGGAADELSRPAAEEGVVSRTHMCEEQRRIKQQFEEKQRDEARRSARQEKAAAKKAHAQILKQIKDDRESQRLRRGAAPAGGSTAPGTASPRAKEPRTEEPSAEPQRKCLLQIRLPNGSAIRHSFPPDAVLQHVWDHVTQTVKVDNDTILMQPFPRQEYDQTHMQQTLVELGLTPSGSLVLKKKESRPAQTPAAESAEAAGSASAGSVDADDECLQTGPAMPSSPPAAVAMPVDQSPPPAPSHQWGEGQRMVEDQMEDDPPLEEAIAEAGPLDEEPVEMGSDEDEDSDDEGPGAGGIPWLGGPGPGGWGGGGGGGGGWGQGMEMHQWGEGQRLIGEVLEPENLPHHAKSAKEMAAEAAGQRQAQPEPAAAAAGGGDDHLSPVCSELPSLVELIIRQVSTRVCDTRQPITSFQGLPADVAMKILAYLIKERLLRPKTLHPFLSCCLRKMVLDCYPYTTNELLHALRRHTYLTYLSAVDCPLITDKGLTSLRTLKRLKYLNLSNCRQITDTCIPTLQEFPNLVTLALDNTAVTDDGMRRYCERAPPNLQHITLSHTDVTDAIFRILTAVPKLKSLNLEGTQIQSLTGVDRLERLEHLNVSNNRLWPESLRCLSGLSHLVALNISFTLRTGGVPLDGDDVLEAIQGLRLQLLELPDRHTTTDRGIQFISQMPLQTLDLTHYIHVTDAAMPFVGALISLTRLRLSNTKVTDAGIVHISGLKNLRELYLNRTAVTNVGAEVVAQFSHLQELGLMSTGITNAFLTGPTLSRCRQLTKLNLSRNYISNRGVAQLKLPCLTLLNLDCTKVTEAVEVTLRENCPELKKVMLSNLLPITMDDSDM